MKDRILTPSKITAWLDCGHFLNLQHQVDLGVLAPQKGHFGEMAQLLMDKGLEHERGCLAEYRIRYESVFEVPGRHDRESFAAWVARVGNPMDDGHDVIFQMPFVHNGVRGIADFLIRVDHDGGPSSYEPVDAKLARSAAKPGHVLQLCFYAEAIEAMTGVAPVHARIWLGSGIEQAIRLADVRAYWRRLRGQLVDVMNQDVDETTRPEKCAHCDFCEFADHCQTQWRAEDSLTFIAGIRPAEKIALETAGVPTTAALAALDCHVEELDDVRAERLTKQASLQVQARALPEDSPPPFELLEPGEPTAALLGFAAMPGPDEGDVFLDYEGDPFWRADRGLFFLFGLLTHGPDGEPVYEARWAHDIDEESAQTLALIEYFARRREEYPGMHVYHYNHTERSALEALAASHSVGEDVLAELVDGGLFVDLLKIVRESLVAGVESYGLKNIERLAGYERHHEIDKGSGAVVEYERYMADHDPARLERIAVYNRDDVEATLALHQWLVEQRGDDLPWRPAFVEPPESPYAEINAQVVALHEFEPGTLEHLLGDVLGYWRREGRVEMAHLLGKLGSDAVDQVRDQDMLTGLQYTGEVERRGKNDRVLQPGLGFTYPVQTVASKYGAGKASVMFSTGDGPPAYANVESLDAGDRSFTMTMSQKYLDLGVIPSAAVLKDTFNDKPKLDALSVLATEVLDAAGVPRVGLALLRNDSPTFADGHGPTDGRFSDDPASILGWAPHLQHSVVAIQGPPGTGKTYTGAHIVLELVRRNKRVGITAMSHNAINNLLREVVKVFTEAGEMGRLHAIRKGPDALVAGLEAIEFATGNRACASADYNVVAGTSWLFAGEDMRDAPVDVLLIDEAGQLALADALAASMSTNSLLLLGDPAQLAQVSQAVHPGGSGASVLEHVLGEAVTIPDDRGVFLAETRRMHPDVCAFISEQIYEGRLGSHPSCAAQSTDFGTGLRWLRAEHIGCSTSSPEEAVLVRDAIAAQIGHSWTDNAGVSHLLTAADYMVVAPYNDQIAELRKALDSDDRTRGVRAGTVDKFQGQEAPVVFFTMTTSADADMPRGADFLFSKNRLNVAISRARCLAYIVCTDELLNTRARDVEEMKLIATLCAFVEQVTPVNSGGGLGAAPKSDR